jgi:hypothetical protein
MLHCTWVRCAGSQLCTEDAKFLEELESLDFVFVGRLEEQDLAWIEIE